MNCKLVPKVNALVLLVAGFCIFCGLLVFESGFFRTSEDKPDAEQGCIVLAQTAVAQEMHSAEKVVEQERQLRSATTVLFGADNAAAEELILGSVDPDSGYQFRLELSSKGAGLKKATFSGFDDRDYKDPKPLNVLMPAKRVGGGEAISLANTGFVFVEDRQQLPLDRLHWKSLGIDTLSDDTQQAGFEAVIKEQISGQPAVRLTKTYRIVRGSYLLGCTLAVENLSPQEHKVRFNLAGPVGISREGARGDMRRVIGGFRDSKGLVVSTSLDGRALNKTKELDDRRLIKPGAEFLWAAITNKYFAAILAPVPAEGKESCDWVSDKVGRQFNPDGDRRGNTGDETVGLDLNITSVNLAPAGQAGSSRTYDFQMYLGPKDKRIFDKNEQYRDLGFVHAITFMPCFCCPTAIIHPLAFGILGLMNWMYGFIGNYGVVIIILVFMIRIVIHPLTKKSQVSMSKMSSLAPKVAELKKKYANNKAELNKQTMALYKGQGASPIMGFLPMMAQMPIWIALYSAIYASIALRGAAFLPFWITDLSSPDALFRFSAVTLPIFGKLDSFNLLPILMGVAFYLQQKLMPKQATAQTDPQIAQQQKMMMVMMPLLFPLMLYKAPSGLNLYIMASTFAGVIEQYVIKKHIREKEQAETMGLVAVTSKTGGKVKKKKPKPFYKF